MRTLKNTSIEFIFISNGKDTKEVGSLILHLYEHLIHRTFISL
ncbi:hypothetical protein P278_21090 [Zhouia amylolytica AD3]|uniref:Uncharacterized protein n=1 Tax=Zhouia amylolytica AD3 TaxID=1286632 RepID=W2UNN2_9FLAO|nr:hypothetical protein P278_21090 [Zhouia amylolytica AD3]